MSDTESGRGMRYDEAPTLKADHACRTIAGADETKWMRLVWRNGGMKFVVGENRLRFVHRENHMEWPRSELGIPEVGGV